MNNEKIELAEIIDTRDEQPPIWVAYPASSTFRILVRPLGGKQQEFIRDATEPVWDLATMQKKQLLNNEKYLRLFGSYVIADWAGLAVDDLKRLVLLDNWQKVKSFTGEIGCDDISRQLLITWSPGFLTWLNRVTLDIERFNFEREEEAEKK